METVQLIVSFARRRPQMTSSCSSSRNTERSNARPLGGAGAGKENEKTLKNTKDKGGKLRKDAWIGKGRWERGRERERDVRSVRWVEGGREGTFRKVCRCLLKSSSSGYSNPLMQGNSQSWLRQGWTLSASRPQGKPHELIQWRNGIHPRD